MKRGRALTDMGLSLTTAAMAEGWEMQVVGNALQARFIESPSVLKGDVNLDETVDFLDISPFISVLSSGGNQAEADVNCDGVVDFLGISPIVGILSGS